MYCSAEPAAHGSCHFQLWDYNGTPTCCECMHKNTTLAGLRGGTLITHTMTYLHPHIGPVPLCYIRSSTSSPGRVALQALLGAVLAGIAAYSIRLLTHLMPALPIALATDSRDNILPEEARQNRESVFQTQ